MHNNVSYTKTSLCADVQLNSTNLDFQPIIITCALFPPDPSFSKLALTFVPAVWPGLNLLEAKLHPFSFKLQCDINIICSFKFSVRKQPTFREFAT